MTGIDELARRVADAALAMRITASAQELLENSEPVRPLRTRAFFDADRILGKAFSAAWQAHAEAVREYRARVEAAAFMAQPGVRRGLEGVGEMEANQYGGQIND